MAALTSTLAHARDAVCYADRMINAQPSFLPGADDREDEDTIEIQLSPTEIGVLVRAAEEAERDAGSPTATQPPPLALCPPPDNSVQRPMPPQLAPKRRGKQPYLVAAGSAILLALSVTIAYQLGTRARSAPPVLPAPVTAPAESPAPMTPSLPAPEEQMPVPVRFANPFDRSEIFEFPPGTSDAEARDAVAALLLKRAQERLTPPRRPTPSLAQRT